MTLHFIAVLIVLECLFLTFFSLPSPSYSASLSACPVPIPKTVSHPSFPVPSLASVPVSVNGDLATGPMGLPFRAPLQSDFSPLSLPSHSLPDLPSLCLSSALSCHCSCLSYPVACFQQGDPVQQIAWVKSCLCCPQNLEKSSCQNRASLDLAFLTLYLGEVGTFGLILEESCHL